MKLIYTILTILALTIVVSAAGDRIAISKERAMELRALKAERDFEQIWMQNAIQTVIQGNPQIKEHNDRLQQKSEAYQALEQQTFKEAKVAESTHTLSLETAEFIPKP